MLKNLFKNFGILVIGILFYLPLLIKIITFKETLNPQQKLVIIILGAQVTKDGISPVLKRRLDLALKLAKEQTVFIVSGAKGDDEPISEASAMCKYLSMNQVLDKNIIVEEKATNTFQNLIYTKKFFNQKRPIIVSSKTHLYRCYIINKRLNVQAYYQGSKPQKLEYLREPFAIVKTYLYDRNQDGK